MQEEENHVPFWKFAKNQKFQNLVNKNIFGISMICWVQKYGFCVKLTQVPWVLAHFLDPDPDEYEQNKGKQCTVL